MMFTQYKLLYGTKTNPITPLQLHMKTNLELSLNPAEVYIMRFSARVFLFILLSTVHLYNHSSHHPDLRHYSDRNITRVIYKWGFMKVERLWANCRNKVKVKVGQKRKREKESLFSKQNHSHWKVFSSPRWLSFPIKENDSHLYTDAIIKLTEAMWHVKHTSQKREVKDSCFWLKVLKYTALLSKDHFIFFKCSQWL